MSSVTDKLDEMRDILTGGFNGVSSLLVRSILLLFSSVLSVPCNIRRLFRSSMTWDRSRIPRIDPGESGDDGGEGGVEGGGGGNFLHLLGLASALSEGLS